MANKDLKTVMQELPAEEKLHMAEAFARYDTAKKTNTNVAQAYNEVRDILKGIEQRYDVTIFVSIVPEQKLIDKIVDKFVEKTAPQLQQQPTAQPVQNPIAQPVQNPVAQPVQSPVAQPVQQPVAQPVQQPVAQPVQQPVAQPVQNPVAQPVQQPQQQPCYTCVFTSLAQANAWLAQQRNVLISDVQVQTSRVGLDIEQIRLLYQILPQAYSYYYQITELMKHRFFAKSKPEKVRDRWQKDNPNRRYVASTKKTWGFSLMGSSIGFFRYIKEKYIILFTTY